MDELGFYFLSFLTRVIVPGIHLILAVLSSGGACFIRRGWNECLGVEWEVYLCLGLGFYRGGG